MLYAARKYKALLLEDVPNLEPLLSTDLGLPFEAC